MSQTEKDKYHGIASMGNLKKKKMIQMNLLTKQKQTHRLKERTYSYQEEMVVGRDNEGVWTDTYIFKIDNQQGPTL